MIGKKNPQPSDERATGRSPRLGRPSRLSCESLPTRARTQPCDLRVQSCLFVEATLSPRLCVRALVACHRTGVMRDLFVMPPRPRYTEDLCPHVSRHGECSNACPLSPRRPANPDGDYCPFAHTAEEIAFHPLVCVSRSRSVQLPLRILGQCLFRREVPSRPTARSAATRGRGAG